MDVDDESSYKPAVIIHLPSSYCGNFHSWKPPFSGFPMVFLWFSMVFPWFSCGSPWFSCGFPVVFLWFSYGFPLAQLTTTGNQDPGSALVAPWNLEAFQAAVLGSPEISAEFTSWRNSDMQHEIYGVIPLTKMGEL